MEIKVQQVQKPQRLIDNRNDTIAVCAYCRVSTGAKDQKNSYEAQKSFFSRLFSSHENWVGKTIFADKGISGTSLKNRGEFNSMIYRAMAGEFSIILTKEVSRFSRNLRDIINIVTDLRKVGVFVWFMSDDIFTEDDDYRERLLDIGARAEHESAKISERVVWGQTSSMINGTVLGRKEMLGYRLHKGVDGRTVFEIVPEEADTIKYIFESYCNGKGIFKIAKELEQKNIPTLHGTKSWRFCNIINILKNEKYCGDVFSKKTYTIDFLSHKRAINTGEEERIFICDHHPAIISRPLWEKAQKILSERAKHQQHHLPNPLSGKVVCGICGGKFEREFFPRSNGIPQVKWRCIRAHLHGPTGEKGCKASAVDNRIITQGVQDIITQIITPNYNHIKAMLSEQKDISLQATNKNRIKLIESKKADIERTKNELSKSLMNFAEGVISEDEYHTTFLEKQKIIDAIEEEMSMIYGSMSVHSISYDATLRIERVLDLLTSEPSSTFTYDIIDQLVERIEICPSNIIKYHLYTLSTPVTMSYKIYGKGKTYSAVFTIV